MTAAEGSGDVSSRRFLLSSMATAAAAAATALVVGAEAGAAADIGVPEASYEVGSTSALPLGLGTMASKSRPVTGILLANPPQRASSDGQVTAEIESTDGRIIASSFLSPTWKLVEGAAYDVEVRDRQNGEGCYLQLVDGKNKNIASLPASFFTSKVLSPGGRFGAYGAPVSIKVLSDRMSADGLARLLEFSFSSLSPTYVETPRHAIVSATMPRGAKEEKPCDDILMIVGSASQARWKKGADTQLLAAVESFKATVFTPSRNFKRAGVQYKSGFSEFGEARKEDSYSTMD